MVSSIKPILPRINTARNESGNEKVSRVVGITVICSRALGFLIMRDIKAVRIVGEGSRAITSAFGIASSAAKEPCPVPAPISRMTPSTS